MNRWGLTDAHMEMVRKTFSEFPEICKAVIFGSRAMGNFKPGSDVDIALCGEGGLECVSRTSAILNEEQPLPFFFDVVDYAAITSPALREHIDRVGQEIYRK